MLYLPLPKAHISSPSTAAVLDLAAQGPGWRKLRNTSSMCHGRWNDRKDRCLPYYNRPTQDGLRGHFVLRAIGKRFRKDRTAGCEKVVGIRFALDSSLEGWREMDSNFRFREDGSSFWDHTDTSSCVWQRRPLISEMPGHRSMRLSGRRLANQRDC